MPKVVSATERAEPTYPITSVGNTLRLLLLFRERKAIRLSYASYYMGVANSTVHRLLAMLVHYGLPSRTLARR
ncbi:MAG: helix-turn-helix domain-containing protein [Geodermatophilaceae bacterium]|nr:helix-turn-helix domain-containing protein [Geodermatophilaceae bacterium]